MSILLFLSIAVYGYLIIRRWIAWKRLPVVETGADRAPSTRLSVIIPVRNEARHILNLLQDLEQQTYPKALFEVLVVDDHSDDSTATIVEEYRKTSELNLHLVQLAAYEGLTQKKAAVRKGVELSAGELLVLTDGDCRVQPEWLQLYAQVYTSRKPYFISGPVSFHNTHTLFERMQLVEFASLIGVGAASIGMGKPNMCNGANLAYAKEAFEKVGGFSGNEHLASGDDEFLLHKIHQKYPGRIAFLKDSRAIVHTEARKTIRSFIAQRVRWASKWKSYQQRHVQLVALSVFLVNLLLFAAIPMVLTGMISWFVFAAAYITKFAIDFLFLMRILTFFGRKQYLFYMLPLQLVYIPYVLFTAVCGLFGRYSWKGRIIRN